MADLVSIAGLVVSGLSLLNDLRGTIGDITQWAEADLEVDSHWLSVALEKGVLDGDEATDFVWAAERKVPTLELKGEHQVVVAFNKQKEIIYRITLGQRPDRLILMRRIS